MEGGLKDEREFLDTGDSWKVLVIDDDQEAIEQAKECIKGLTYADKPFHVTCSTEFDRAVPMLKLYQIDLVILDLRQGSRSPQMGEEEAGEKAHKAIRAYRFVPVIYWTNFPLPESHNPPWVYAVRKSEGTAALEEAIMAVMRSRLPELSRLLSDHLRDVERSVLNAWADSSVPQVPKPGSDLAEIAYYLLRRLGRSLEREQVGSLIQKLDPNWRDDVAHPLQYYLRPPVGDLPMTGDIFVSRRTTGHLPEYAVLLTPTCAMVHGKASRYLFARCIRVIEHEIVQKIAEHEGNLGKHNQHRKRLEELIAGKHERYYFLPEALGIPALLVDFENLVHMTPEEVERDWERIAALDSPYAEALVSRFTRFYLRIGTPDLDAEAICQSIVNSVVDRGMSAAV